MAAIRPAIIYRHTQSTPAMTWTIVHNLDGYPIVDVYVTDGGNLQKKVYQDGRCRKLTPLEYERLQTLPDNYTAKGLKIYGK